MDISNWIYSKYALDQMSVDARELALFMENDYHLWMKRRQDFWKNLDRKERRGIFDVDKAVVLMGYFVKEGAKRYGSSFDKSDREQVARWLVCRWSEQFTADEF